MYQAGKSLVHVNVHNPKDGPYPIWSCLNLSKLKAAVTLERFVNGALDAVSHGFEG